MRVVLILKRCNKGIDLIHLLFTAIPKADDINSHSILLQLLGKDLECLHIFRDGRADEANHPLFLGLIGAMFERECSDLYGLLSYDFYLCEVQLSCALDTEEERVSLD